LDRPSVYAKSVRKGTVSTILVSVLLIAACLVQVTPSPAAQGGDDATMRHMVQYTMSVGQRQYDRGDYGEALKTLLSVHEYVQYLEPVEQRKFQSLREKAGRAAQERQQILEARQVADQLTRKGDVVAARARLASIKDSEFLTDAERQEIARALNPPAPSALTGGGAPSRAGAIATVSAPTQDVQNGAGSALEQYKTGIAETYRKSVTAYHEGDFKTAKEGFAKVLRSGLVSADMADTIRARLAEIDAVEAGQAAGRPVLPVEASAQIVPMAGTTTPASTPLNFRAQNSTAGPVAPGERERIQELYNRSRELYIQGELAAARQGFAEVARSGLISAPPGLRPEDYVAQIDQQLAAQGAPAPSQPAAPSQMVPVTPAPTNGPSVTPPAGQPVPMNNGDGGFIEEINRRRNIVRSFTENTVNDAVDQAQMLMAQGDFASARARVENATRVVNENQAYLGAELYRQHTQRLDQTAGRIREAETQRETQLAGQRRQESADAQRRLRVQAEEDRQRRIDELIERARAYWKQQQYEAALGQLEALLLIDPLHDQALTLKDMVEDMIYFRKQLEQEKLSRKQTADIKLNTDEATIPYADEITYPKNWREIIEKPTRKPEAPFQLDPENEKVYEQLDQVVDLSTITAQTPVSEAFNLLRNSIQPPLNLVVLWRDLLENALIDPTSAVEFDGPSNVRLGTALDNMLSALTDPLAGSDDYRVEYVVNQGVVTVATRLGLPRSRLETRVYDVSDLVSPPSTGMSGMMGGA